MQIWEGTRFCKPERHYCPNTKLSCNGERCHGANWDQLTSIVTPETQWQANNVRVAACYLLAEDIVEPANTQNTLSAGFRVGNWNRSRTTLASHEANMTKLQSECDSLFSSFHIYKMLVKNDRSKKLRRKSLLKSKLRSVTALQSGVETFQPGKGRLKRAKVVINS